MLHSNTSKIYIYRAQERAKQFPAVKNNIVETTLTKLYSFSLSKRTQKKTETRIKQVCAA